MMANGQFVADLLSASASGIASLAADRLVSQRPDMRDRYRPRPVTAWRECVASRLPYLASALSTGCPKVFVEQARWASTAYSSRGGQQAADDFLASLESLREVIREQLPADSAKLAAAYVDHAIDTLRLAPLRPATALDPATRLGRLTGDYLAAVLEGDRRRASAIILSAARGQDGRPPVPPRELYLSVLLPAQIELGRMWHLNEATVAEEHFATATTLLVLSQLFEMLDFAPRNGKVAVAASVEGNAHDVGVRMLADLLEAEGWRVIYLGASVPAQDLAQAADMFEADLVAVSAGLGCQLPTVADTIEAIRSASRRGALVRILVGGAGFVGTDVGQANPLWKRFGADGFAASIDDGLRMAAELCRVHAK